MFQESLANHNLITSNRIIGATVVVGFGALVARAAFNKSAVANEPQLSQSAVEMDRRRNLFAAVIRGEVPAEEFVQDLTARFDLSAPE